MTFLSKKQHLNKTNTRFFFFSQISRIKVNKLSVSNKSPYNLCTQMELHARINLES